MGVSSLKRGGLLILLVQPVRLFKDDQVPRNPIQLTGMCRRPLIGGQHDPVGQGIAGHFIRHRKPFLQHLAPLPQQRQRYDDQNPIAPFIIELSDDQQCFEGLAKRTFITQHRAFEVSRAQHKPGCRHLIRKNLQLRRCENRQQRFCVGKLTSSCQRMKRRVISDYHIFGGFPHLFSVSLYPSAPSTIPPFPRKVNRRSYQIALIKVSVK